MVIIAQAPASASLAFAAVASTVATTAVFNVIAGEPGAGSQTSLSLPGSNRLNAQQFVVRASGILTLGAGTYTATVQPLICASTTAGFTATAANAIFSTTAVSVTPTSASAVSYPWYAEVTLEGDSTSGTLNGTVRGAVANVQTPTTAASNTWNQIVNGPTSVNFATEPPLQFAVAVQSVANGGFQKASSAQLTQFSIEA